MLRSLKMAVKRSGRAEAEKGGIECPRESGLAIHAGFEMFFPTYVAVGIADLQPPALHADSQPMEGGGAFLAGAKKCSGEPGLNSTT